MQSTTKQINTLLDTSIPLPTPSVTNTAFNGGVITQDGKTLVLNKDGSVRKQSGRPKGAKTKIPNCLKVGYTPLMLFKEIYQDPKRSHADRFKAAATAAPYIHAKLQSIQSVSVQIKIETKADIEQMLIQHNIDPMTVWNPVANKPVIEHESVHESPSKQLPAPSKGDTKGLEPGSHTGPYSGNQND